jgi:hypothetical protein
LLFIENSQKPAGVRQKYLLWSTVLVEWLDEWVTIHTLGLEGRPVVGGSSWMRSPRCYNQ